MSTHTLYYQSPLVHASSPYTIAAAPLRANVSVQPQHLQPNSHRRASNSGTSGRSVAAVTERKSVLPASSKSKNMSHQDQLQSPFFRLPAELRNQIYTSLLCPNALSPTQLQTQTKDLSVRGFNQTSTPATLHPSILSTCKRINEEAGALLYSTSIFHANPALLTSLPHLQSPSRPVLYPSVTSLIRRWQICLRLDTDPRFTFEQAAKAFSGAEYLEIRVWQAQFEACDWSVLKLFTGVRGVGVARVGGSVHSKLARWLEGLMMRPMHKGEDVCMCKLGKEDDERFEGRREELCGICYKRASFEWPAGERDIWRFGGR